MENKTIQGLCYELYKNDWMRRISADEAADILKNWYQETEQQNRTVYPPERYIEDNGYKQGMYACFEEFLDCEYKDAGYMKKLLDNDELFAEYEADVSFICNVDMREIADSLELSSGTVVASMNIGGSECRIEVVGDIAVVYNEEGTGSEFGDDIVFHDPKEYTDEVREIIHSGNRDSSPYLLINLNNWFEIMYKGKAEHIDCEWMDEDQLKEELLLFAKEVNSKEA